MNNLGVLRTDIERTIDNRPYEKQYLHIVGDGGAGVRWTPLLEVSTDRGGSRELRRPLSNNK